MFPIQVALVPHEEVSQELDLSELLRVVAALQIQVTRDFTPIWGISGVVSAFLSFDELPPACIPLVIVPQLYARDRGFHISRKGHPVGLIEHRDGWPLIASHELLEILCDPQGKRKVLGESLADSHPNQVVRGARAHRRQGQVEYLLEVCDPCQTCTYTVNGFQMSDFVTPHYYAPGATHDQRYSFTGKVRKPREVLRGGYITWYTSIPESPVWQATRDLDGTLTVGPMTVPAPRLFSREFIEHLTDVFGTTSPVTASRDQAKEVEALARESAERYGSELADDVRAIRKAVYQAGHSSPEASLKDLEKVLRELADNEAFWTQFKDQPDQRSRILTRFLGEDISSSDTAWLAPSYPDDRYPDRVPSQEQFQAVHKPIKALLDRETDPTRRGFSGLVAAMAMQGTT